MSNQIVLGLERVREMVRRMGVEKPDFPVITIGGTNGKGSCTAMLTSVYGEAGYRVGTYTSPHLFCFQERIRIQNQPVSEEKLCEAFSVVENARGDIPLTYFEFITLASLWIFQQEELDVVLLEVGMGGRLDAVNIWDADLAVITSIDLDHMDYLGETREAIALEKAGILREGKLAVCGEPDPPITLTNYAADKKILVYYRGKDFFIYTQNLWKSEDCLEERTDSDEGKYEGRKPISDKQSSSFQRSRVYTVDNQKDPVWEFKSASVHLKNLSMPILAIENAAIACQTAILMQPFLPLDIKKAMSAILTTRLPGRCDIRKSRSGIPVIFDVAHNPHAMNKLKGVLENYKTLNKVKKTAAIFSMLKDKDIKKSAAILDGLVDEWHIAEINDKRAASIHQLQEALAFSSNMIVIHENLAKAYECLQKNLLPDDLIVIFGSFFTVGEVMKCENQGLSIDIFKSFI